MLFRSQDGRLIDTHAGQSVPDNQPQYEPVCGEELKAFKTLTMEDMVKNVSRHIDLRRHATGGLTNDSGVHEFAIIGDKTDGEGMPAGKISRPHNFQLRRLMLDSGATIAKHSRKEQEVLFVHRGSLNISTDEGSLTLGTGDLFTCPIGLTRCFANEGNETADIIVLRGGDNPGAANYY